MATLQARHCIETLHLMMTTSQGHRVPADVACVEQNTTKSPIRMSVVATDVDFGFATIVVDQLRLTNVVIAKYINS